MAVWIKRPIPFRRPPYPFQLNKDADLARGLIFWVPCNDTGGNLKEMINGNDGTLNADATRSYGGTGDLDSGLCLTCDGAGDYSSHADHAAINITTYSVSAWGMLTNLTNWRNLLYKTSSQYGMIFDSSGAWNAQFNGGSNLAGGTIVTNTWYQLGYSLESSGGTAVTYQNGTAISSGARANSTAAGALTIGTDLGNTRWWNGGIADVRIYNRVLSPSEYMKLYDPRTRWDIYWVPSSKLYSFPYVSSASQYISRTLLGVG